MNLAPPPKDKPIGIRKTGITMVRSNISKIWQDRDGNCLRGSWYAAGPQMCFVYDNDPEPDCWTMSRTDDGRVMIESTRLPDDPAVPPLVLELIRRTPLPIACTGPLLGV